MGIDDTMNIYCGYIFHFQCCDQSPVPPLSPVSLRHVLISEIFTSTLVTHDFSYNYQVDFLHCVSVFSAVFSITYCYHFTLVTHFLDCQCKAWFQQVKAQLKLLGITPGDTHFIIAWRAKMTMSVKIAPLQPNLDSSNH